MKIYNFFSKDYDTVEELFSALFAYSQNAGIVSSANIKALLSVIYLT